MQFAFNLKVNEYNILYYIIYYMNTSMHSILSLLCSKRWLKLNYRNSYRVHS